MACTMFADPDVFRAVATAYDPSFLSVPLEFEDFPKIVKRFPEYVLIFFDDAEALYVNRVRHPALANQYEIVALDPFQLHRQDVEEVFIGNERERMLNEARRLLEVFPDGGVTNLAAALSAIKDGKPDQAFAHAETLISRYPEWSAGYYAKAEAFRALGRLNEAIAAYQLALSRSSGRERSRALRGIGMAYLAQHRYAKANHALQAGVDPMSRSATLQDLYCLAAAALLAGKRADAEVVFASLVHRLTRNDGGWSEKAARASRLFSLYKTANHHTAPAIIEEILALGALGDRRPTERVGAAR